MSYDDLRRLVIETETDRAMREATRDTVTRAAGWLSLVAILCLVLLTTACAHGPTKSERLAIAAAARTVDVPELPDDTFLCAGEPGVPARDKGRRLRESQVAGYIVDLRSAGADCRRKHGVLSDTYRAVQAESRAIPPVEEN